MRAQKSRNEMRRVAVQAAGFQGNYAHNLTSRQFSDFRADAQKLANEIDSEFPLSGIRAGGEEFTLAIKPMHYVQ